MKGNTKDAHLSVSFDQRRNAESSARVCVCVCVSGQADLRRKRNVLGFFYWKVYDMNFPSSLHRKSQRDDISVLRPGTLAGMGVQSCVRVKTLCVYACVCAPVEDTGQL